MYPCQSLGILRLLFFSGVLYDCTAVCLNGLKSSWG